MGAKLSLKPFSTLNRTQRRTLLAFLAQFGPPSPFPDEEAMRKELGGPVFNRGDNFLTLWTEEGTITGTIGVVTREAQTKGEIFLTSIYVEPRPGEVIKRLIDEAYQVARSTEGVYPGITLRLGVRENLSYLKPEVEKAGLKATTRLLELRLDARALPISEAAPISNLKFVPLSKANLSDFVAVHNAAFLTSPNAGQLSMEEAREMLKEAVHADLLQIGYAGTEPAVMFDLRLQDGAGWIDGLGVHPEHQGRGLGKVALRRAIAVLREHGTEEVRLIVVEANTRALLLYRRAGFRLDKVFSTSYAGALPPQ